ncbi:MAG: MBL fold metallo-hydrolase [Candidatus Stygibacter frigidus]|nr:MBL fold metallo-hydrolase [Candidatus Stygibacter frigidus]
MTEAIKIRIGGTNIYLLQSEFNFYVMIDTPISTGKNKLLQKLSHYGISPSQIKLIIITHSHTDHTGSLAFLKELTGAKVIAQQKAAAYIEMGRSAQPVLTNQFLNKLADKYLSRHPEFNKFEPVKTDIIFNEEYELSEWGIKGKIISTPGHSKGSSTIILEEDVSFVGDALFNISPFTITPPIIEDKAELHKSWQKMIKSSSQYFYPGHGPRISRQRFLKAIKKASK